MDFTKTFSTTTPQRDSKILETNIFLRLFYYFVSAVLGIIGGGLSVALVLGFLLALELGNSAGQPFDPGLILTGTISSGLGIGLAWMIFDTLHRLPLVTTFQRLDRSCLQVTLVFSALTVLLEIFLYLHNVSI